jgi:hypothetical protein
MTAVVRNVECRTSICALEVASNTGVYRGVEADSFYSDHFVPGLPLYARERDPLGGEVTVITYTLMRKESH